MAAALSRRASPPALTKSAPRSHTQAIVVEARAFAVADSVSIARLRRARQRWSQTMVRAAETATLLDAGCCRNSETDQTRDVERARYGVIRDGTPAAPAVDMTSTANRPSIDDPETFEILGAAFEVHREFGPGFPESVYREAFSMELLRRGVPIAREVGLKVYYKGEVLPMHYRADFVCYDHVLVELKAVCEPPVPPHHPGQSRAPASVVVIAGRLNRQGIGRSGSPLNSPHLQ